MNSITDGIEFRSAWRANDAAVIRDANQFWANQNIPPSLTKGRENEICTVAYLENEVVAVSTASIFFEPLMQNKFFGYRCMIAPQVRQQNLAWRISAFSLKILQEWSARNVQERILGLMICVETDKFTAGLRKPVREKFGFAMHFVGYTATGQQLRAVWFDHAMLDDSLLQQ